MTVLTTCHTVRKIVDRRTQMFPGAANIRKFVDAVPVCDGAGRVFGSVRTCTDFPVYCLEVFSRGNEVIGYVKTHGEAIALLTSCGERSDP
jgi:hypothetical protein